MRNCNKILSLTSPNPPAVAKNNADFLTAGNKRLGWKREFCALWIGSDMRYGTFHQQEGVPIIHAFGDVPKLFLNGELEISNP